MASKIQQYNNKTIKLLLSLSSTGKSINETQSRRKYPLPIPSSCQPIPPPPSSFTSEGVNAEFHELIKFSNKFTVKIKLVLL